MLSVWHKADIYRIPIYAPVTMIWREERCTNGTSFCGKALARAVVQLAAAQLCRHRRLRWRAVVAQTGLAVQATAVA